MTSEVSDDFGSSWYLSMRRTIMNYRFILFYSFAFLISWIFWFLMYQYYRGTADLTIYVFSTIGGLGPLLSLKIVEMLSKKKEVEVKRILSTAKIRGAKKQWFVPAILALPVMTVIGSIMLFLMGQEGNLRLIKPGPDELGFFVLPVMAIYLAASLITSPLFEEPGWRGFALVGLQRRFGREVGSLLVGSLWWLWHQPMNLTFGIQPTLY